jgi:hypothetical protein
MNTPSSASAPRERGGCLTLYLLLVIIGSIFGVFSAFSLNASLQALAAQGVEVAFLPSWYAPATVVPVILSLIGGYGAWNWKKWGLYALAAAIVVSTVISILAGQMVSGIISLLIGGVLLWYVTKDKMAWFS